MDMRVGCERVDCLIFCQRLCTLSFAIVVSNTRTYIYIYICIHGSYVKEVEELCPYA